MKTTLIQGALLVNEGKIVRKDLRIIDEKIAKIADALRPIEGEELIDAKGKYLLPGLIDDQVHFREPGLTHKACIHSESRAAVAGGITSFIEMPNTVPQTTTCEKLDEKLAIAQENSLANYGFMFGGTNDNFDEIQRLDTRKAAGLKLFLGSSTGNMLVDDEQTLRKIFANTKMVISVHCEDEPTIKANLASHIATYGNDIPIEKHPIIRSHEACYRSSSKAIALAKETGARLHVFHLSTAQETALFDNTIPLEEKKITAEVCVHHLWFSSEDYAQKGTMIKWNPAVKNSSDRSALWEALNDDRIDILATDHAPHTREEKNKVYTQAPSGGPLVQHALLAMLTAVKQEKISLEKLVQKACHNPAILFQIERRGYLREGYQADMVLVDLDQTTKVTQDNLLYQCGWSPFEGTTFDARIEQTWVNGTTVFTDGKIVESKSAQPLKYSR